MDKKLIEKLAELEHIQWAHWAKYMLNNMTWPNLERWNRQIETSYSDLTEEEKDSDREWAERVYAIFVGRLEIDKELFTSLLLESDYTSGYASAAELYFKGELDTNPEKAKECILDIFVEKYDDLDMLQKILGIISHVEYEKLYPECIPIASTALCNSDNKIVEMGIRCFENWGNPEYSGELVVLKSRYKKDHWLNEYAEKVIKDLEEGASE